MLEFGPMQEASPMMRFMLLSSVRTERIELARYGSWARHLVPRFGFVSVWNRASSTDSE
jgi:hypothetical protein